MSDGHERTPADSADAPATPNEPRDEARGTPGVTRRKFLAYSAAGVGLLFGAGYLTRGIWRRYLAELASTFEPPYSGPTDPSLWFEVLADDSIVLHSTKVEMGQGVLTGLAQIAADELDVDIERIRVEHAHTASGNIDDFATGGSTSLSSLWTPMREMAATLRETIRLEGARQLGTDPAQVSVAGGVLRAGERSLSYGEIVSAAGEWRVAETPELKDPSDYRYVGRPVARVDLEDKVVGAPIFGLDAEMPDMLHASVVRPEQIGARIDSVDAGRAEGMPGVVRVVVEDDLVGVIAESFTQADRAREALEVEWSVERTWEQADIRQMTRVGQGTPYVIQKEGDVERAFERGEVVEAEYDSPIGAHAQIEPGVALAHATEDGAVVQVSTQVVELTRREVAEALEISESKVDIQPTFLGGGFGRRLHTPIAAEAARLSAAVGRPVKLVNSRKQEFQRDTFRPPTHHLLRATLSEDGGVESIEHNTSSGAVAVGSPLYPPAVAALIGADIGAWRGGMIQYRAIPNHQAVSWKVELPFATSWWRSLGLLANTFAIESFIDELAEAAGRDPVEFRLAHIQDDEAGYRLREVIREAASQAGWTREIRDGVAMGFAASTDVGTPCAHVAEVSVEEGRIRVHRVTCVIDPGLAVNPDQIRAQCEGSVIMGLSASMFEEMNIREGVLEPTIYGPYRMATLADAPREVKVHILENADSPGGVGEPPLGPIGAAIGNAVWRLTGTRLRSMPLQPAFDRATGDRSG